MAADKKRTFTYYVNGEPQETNDNMQTMEEVLTRAELMPASDYILEEDENHKEYTDPSVSIHLHKAQRFTATYKGTTPTS